MIINFYSSIASLLLWFLGFGPYIASHSCLDFVYVCFSLWCLSGQVGWYFDFLLWGIASSPVRLCFSIMADSGQSSSQTPDINNAILAKSVTTLQTQFQQICDALSDKLGNDSNALSIKEGCNNDLADGRSDCGSEDNYHKGTSSPVCYWSLRIECCRKCVCWPTSALQQSGNNCLGGLALRCPPSERQVWGSLLATRGRPPRWPSG